MRDETFAVKGSHIIWTHSTYKGINKCMTDLEDYQKGPQNLAVGMAK